MSTQLTPSLIPLNGKYVESYERVSRATPEAKTAVGLDPNGNGQNLIASVGVASISEYILITGKDISVQEGYVAYTSNYQQPLKLESVFASSPHSDTFAFSVLYDNNYIFRMTLQPNQTPYEFPCLILPFDSVLHLHPTQPISYIQFALKPVALHEVATISIDNPI